MKLTIQRDTTIRDIEPGEVFVNDDGRWVVDEVRRTLAGVGLYCKAEGSTSERRKLIEFKSLEEKVVAEAGPQDSAELLGLLHKMIAPPDEAEKWPYDAAAGTLMLTLGTRVQGKIAGRIWTVKFEA